ncbi:MAG TPA: phytoene dehydrogenase [Polyangiaceae bacterium]|nr:phytoene dehydrogenase [Polyangiaceae bacterium]
MTSRHYDVVVLGRSLGALSAAALLARRDFRVLLLGQGQRAQTYRFEEHVLARRTFSLLAGSSPTWRRILHELAQSPQFRRHAVPLDPMFVMLSEGRRVEVPPDMELFGREIEREYPEVRQLVDELYGNIAQVNAVADAAFERDALWPPGTLWERFETGRIAATLPLTRGERGQDLLGKFPAGHAYRDITTIPALFASNSALLGGEFPPFALARLHGAWTRGVVALARAEEELSEFLCERIEAHGGVIELGRRATSLVTRRGVALGVIEDGEESLTGASAVISDQSGEVLAQLSNGEGVTKAARDDWPRLSSEAGRFVVSLVVRTHGLPEPLSREAFVLPSDRLRRDPRHPTVHLQRHEARVFSEARVEARGETLLIAEAILPARGALTLLEAREAVLGTLKSALPFLEQHLLLVDSPHDGLPLYDYRGGARREVDRVHVQGGAPAAESMERLWNVEPAGYVDIGGEPVRGPIPNTYLVGKTVLPGLGQEGELIAAFGAARIITRKDSTRQKMRRQMWSKIETT